MQAYILPVLVAIVPFLVALAAHCYNLLLSHLPMSQQELLTQAAHTAVQAAEQSALTNDGKKRLATAVVNGAMSTWGLKIDPMYVDATIEALVLALNKPVDAKVEVVVPPVIVPVEQKPIVLGQQNTLTTGV